MGKALLQIKAGLRTKWDKSYCKVGQVICYKVGQSLLQYVNLYYKVGQVLQNGAIITK